MKKTLIAIISSATIAASTVFTIPNVNETTASAKISTGPTDGDAASELGFSISHGLFNSRVNYWHKGPHDNATRNIVAKYYLYGKKLKLTSEKKYFNASVTFKDAVIKAKVKGKAIKKPDVSGSKRYKKDGKFIDLTPKGQILNFGK